MNEKPRELLLEEIDMLGKLGYDPKHFLYLARDAESKTFLETQTGKILVLHR